MAATQYNIVYFVLETGITGKARCTEADQTEYDSSQGFVHREGGYECGDLVWVTTGEEEPHMTVVLGCGVTEDTAKDSAREYVRRVAKIHGVEGASQKVAGLFGHDCSHVSVNSQVDI
ncbi:hypothetical protein ONE63_005141 [Megalurothrips usitatus]|uniref:Uncharacterized protein n=1 Tax=Megalurothrips usitatus TaxID=439358 RepID=A0AAV7XUF6_9NEOP|nr:hypothetical protein ONE63_005141 [Megalurothrips usitatus]